MGGCEGVGVRDSACVCEREIARASVCLKDDVCLYLSGVKKD